MPNPLLPIPNPLHRYIYIYIYIYIYVRITIEMIGDFTAENAHVLGDMGQRLAALREDRVFSRSEKELIILTGVCSVLRYSTCRVDWSNPELDKITQSWIKAYIYACSLPKGFNAPGRT